MVSTAPYKSNVMMWPCITVFTSLKLHGVNSSIQKQCNELAHSCVLTNWCIIRQFNNDISAALYNSYVIMWPHISVFISLIVTWCQQLHTKAML